MRVALFYMDYFAFSMYSGTVILCCCLKKASDFRLRLRNTVVFPQMFFPGMTEGVDPGTFHVYACKSFCVGCSFPSRDGT